MIKTTKKAGILALRGLTVLPGMKIQLDISREKSVAVAKRGFMHGQLVFLVSQRDPGTDDPGVADLYQYGTLAKVEQITRMNDKVYKVLIEGISRGYLAELSQETPYLSGMIDILEDEAPEEEGVLQQKALIRMLEESVQQYLKVEPAALRELSKVIYEGEQMTLAQCTDHIMANVQASPQVCQEYLELDEVIGRGSYVEQFLQNEIQVLQIKAEFMDSVKQRIDKDQKEYVLRQQQRMINEELGQDTQSEVDEYAEQTEQLDAPDAVKEKLRKEIRKLRQQPQNSPETALLQNYIESVLEMPWNKKEEEVIDLKKVREVLDRDHYGLEKIKDRILEYLAVRKLTGKGDSPILCLAGPAGTGKTSIAHSVAEALGRKYVRISLGGVRDEADIRGHRKTYIGAMMGRIANAIRQAGVSNPLILLDEIDKMGDDYRGDPSAALLEVLDSEQNHAFRDHFLELDMDLSEVLFIATANDDYGISAPLYDRMDVIYLEGYSANEKFHIAKDHLLEKQLQRNGLTPEQLHISDEVLRILIRGYVKEPGVRGLERKIGDLCRKAARELLEQETEKISIDTLEDVKKKLGRMPYEDMEPEKEPQVGIVNGLAWTSVGGVRMPIEVNLIPGKGDLTLTGQIGNVMQESARIGFSFLQSRQEEFGIDMNLLGQSTIHIHIPEGAVPKDGPSAGISMTTAMLSALTGRKVRQDAAMTGEITLRGHVLPIGGLKEKLLAAQTEGMKLVLIPAKNAPMLEEISQEIKAGMEIRLVSEYAQVAEAVLLPPEESEEPEQEAGEGTEQTTEYTITQGAEQEVAAARVDTEETAGNREYVTEVPAEPEE